MQSRPAPQHFVFRNGRPVGCDDVAQQCRCLCDGTARNSRRRTCLKERGEQEQRNRVKHDRVSSRAENFGTKTRSVRLQRILGNGTHAVPAWLRATPSFLHRSERPLHRPVRRAPTRYPARATRAAPTVRECLRLSSPQMSLRLPQACRSATRQRPVFDARVPKSTSRVVQRLVDEGALRLGRLPDAVRTRTPTCPRPGGFQRLEQDVLEESSRSDVEPSRESTSDTEGDEPPATTEGWPARTQARSRTPFLARVARIEKTVCRDDAVPSAQKSGP